MNLVKQSVKRLWKSPLQWPLQAIEIAGRTCYKSEDRITSDSARGFVQKLQKRGHTAMLEHCWFTLEVPVALFQDIAALYNRPHIHMTWVGKPLISGNATAFNNLHKMCPKITASIQNYLHMISSILFPAPKEDMYDDIKAYVGDLDEHEVLYHQAYSYKCITCRGVTHELVRHRPFSYAQESTRYVNHKDGVTFIIPPWIDLPPCEDLCVADHIDMRRSPDDLESWLLHCKAVEDYYANQSMRGWSAQQARGGLILDLKTEIVITGNKKMFEHLFKLRCDPAAHPQMQEIANLIKEDMYEQVS